MFIAGQVSSNQKKYKGEKQTNKTTRYVIQLCSHLKFSVHMRYKINVCQKVSETVVYKEKLT